MEILFFAFVVICLIRKISNLIWEREVIKKQLGAPTYKFLTKEKEK